MSFQSPAGFHAAGGACLGLSPPFSAPSKQTKLFSPGGDLPLGIVLPEPNLPGVEKYPTPVPSSPPVPPEGKWEALAKWPRKLRHTQGRGTVPPTPTGLHTTEGPLTASSSFWRGHQARLPTKHHQSQWRAQPSPAGLSKRRDKTHRQKSPPGIW